MSPGATLSDAQLVAGVLAGDRSAFAEVYDRYADRLHDFAYAMLRQREEAADAVADAFVTAAEKLGQLRDPDRLRPWLYAVVRRECLRRLRARDRVAHGGDERLLEVTDRSPSPEVRAEQESLRTLVWDAAAGLGDRDRALLDLHLRQGLDGAALGEAMGMSSGSAYTAMNRLRAQVERSLGALLVARLGRRECAELDRVLAGWDGRFSPLVRKRVARHVDGCEVCSRRRAVMVSPLALLAGVPLVAAPAALRDRVLEDPRLVSYLPPGPPPGPGGPWRGRARAATTALAAVTALTVAAGIVGLLSRPEEPRPADPVDAAGSPSAGASPTAAAPPADAPTLSARPSDSSAPRPVPVPATSTPVGDEESAGEEATGTTPTSEPPAPGRLEVSSRALDLGDTTRAGSVQLRNSGEQVVAYAVTGGPAWLTAAPASGTIAPGGSRALTLAADRSQLAEGAHQGEVGISWGRGTVPVRVRASREAPPVVGTPGVVRSWCEQGARNLATTVPVEDESGVAAAVLEWTGAGGAGSTSLAGAGSRWAGVVGPLTAGGPVQLSVLATDSRGNQARRTATLDAEPCPR